MKAAMYPVSYPPLPAISGAGLPVTRAAFHPPELTQSNARHGHPLNYGPGASVGAAPAWSITGERVATWTEIARSLKLRPTFRPWWRIVDALDIPFQSGTQHVRTVPTDRPLNGRLLTSSAATFDWVPSAPRGERERSSVIV
jgi:hypothetical protein